MYFFSLSTFLGQTCLYLEDLYVKPEYRGRGIGKAIFAELARIAAERGCGRLEWQCLDWNEPSINFYKSLGAAPARGWTLYRLTGGALKTLAAEGSSTAAVERRISHGRKGESRA